MVVAVHDWTIRSESDPKYLVQIAAVDRAHAETVLHDLIDNAWTPSDLVLEPVLAKRKRRRWRRG